LTFHSVGINRHSRITQWGKNHCLSKECVLCFFPGSRFQGPHCLKLDPIGSNLATTNSETTQAVGNKTHSSR
jgi:hypothetical protein